MAVKRQEYFAAGVEVVWEVDPRARVVLVYISPTHSTTLGPRTSWMVEPCYLDLHCQRKSYSRN